MAAGAEEFEHEHEPPQLLVPFVVTSSNGGPLDDHSFVQGCRYLDLRTRLTIGRPYHLLSYEHPDLRPQLELLAMELRYIFDAEPYDEDWELVTFRMDSHDDEEPQ